MTRAQIELAVAWWQRFPQATVIFSTGDTQGLGLPDSRVMATYARRLRLPEEVIIEETQSINTYENLVYCRRIVEEQGLRQPALVLYEFHARRTLAIAASMGWTDLFWISARSIGEGAHGIKWLRTFSRPAILAYELAAMVYSRYRGWL